ncbi:MAG: HNH endonuclease [Nitrosopumilus sp.]|nr:HNH endonuclease [Nitrosopumilus sp.]
MPARPPMNYADLEDFIANRMRMTHVYQPIMIHTLLESGRFEAPRQEIARRFMDRDERVLAEYERVVHRWPYQTLRDRGVLEYDKESASYRLRLAEPITEEQRQRLMSLCHEKLEGFVSKDPAILRQMGGRTILGRVRHDVIERSRGTCEACGITSDKSKLDVDHIFPRSKGGGCDISNLQALCAGCNRGKRDRFNTDFAEWRKKLVHPVPECDLCDRPASCLMYNVMAYAVDRTGRGGPCYEIVPSRHVGGFVDLVSTEKQMCVNLVDSVLMYMRTEHPGSRAVLSGFDESDAEHCRISVVARK